MEKRSIDLTQKPKKRQRNDEVPQVSQSSQLSSQDNDVQATN